MLLFDGLYVFGGSVCRLRVLSFEHGEGSRVVVATNLDDAPGASIVNDFEGLVESVNSKFGEQATRWLLHFPKTLAPLSWTEASPAPESGKGPEWRHISTDEAEAITGLDLSTADIEPATIASLAGGADLWHELAQIPEPERLPAEYFAVVPVTALPFAHNPFRCAHHQRFIDLMRLYDDPEGSVVGAHWHLALTADDFARCPFHQCDWRKVADASVAVLESLTPTATRHDLVTACSERPLPPRELESLQSIFVDPIHWIPSSSTVVNGQHRLCALRAAGATQCVVDTDGRYLDRSSPISTVEAAACSSLAKFWIGRTARNREPWLAVLRPGDTDQHVKRRTRRCVGRA